MMRVLSILIAALCCLMIDAAAKRARPSNSNTLHIRYYGAQAHTLDCCEQEIDELIFCLKASSLNSVPPSEKRSKDAILTWSSASVEKFTKYVEAINSAWAHAHGFDFIMVVIDEKAKRDRDIMWEKQLILREYLHMYSFLFYIDADALINALDLKKLINTHNDKDLTICRDSANMKVGGAWLNAGVMLLRNTWWTQMFLIDWWDSGDAYPMYKFKKDNIFMEQGALGHLLETNMKNETYASHVAILPSETFNSITPLYDTFEPNLPVLHFETTGAGIRENVMRKAFVGMCAKEKDFGLSKDILILEYLEGTKKEIETNKNEPFLQQGLARLLLKSAHLRKDGDKEADLQDAISLAEKAVQMNPKEAFHWSSLADTYKSAGRIEEAINARRKAMEVAPGLARFTSSLAQELFAAGKKEEAYKYAKRAIEEEPSEASRYINAAVMYVRDKNVKEALKYYKQAEKLDSNDWISQGGIAYCYTQMEEADEAIKWYKKALKLGPDQYTLHHGYARALLIAKKFDDAHTHLKRALSLSSSPTAQLYYDFARALSEIGQLKQAYEFAKKALALSPQSVDAKNAVKLLGNKLGID